MISFVWSAKQPFLAGRGGSENYTAGHIRELKRRGIPARILTLGYGENDGRDDFPDIQFKALRAKEELSELGDTLVFVTYPIDVPTKRPAYAILHCPLQRLDPPFELSALDDKNIIVPSRFAAKLWGETLRMRPGRLPVVYPFAETCFSKVKRPQDTPGKTKVLFAGRLLPDKGIYTLLAAMHMDGFKHANVELTVTAAAADTPDGQIIEKLLQAHPLVNLISARRTPQGMAELMAEHDVVIMPSTASFWQEIFGIVSVEAQHAGCRVVASNAGGIPETDCGGLVLVRPDDPQALAGGIAKAALLGPLTQAERMYAATQFTVSKSVDALLDILIAQEHQVQMPLPLLQKQGTLVREQLNFAVSTISQLGLQLTGENEFRQFNSRH